MTKSYLVRILVWVPVLAGVLIWRFHDVADAGGGPEPVEPQPAEIPFRPASAEEWAKPIAELGKAKLAKLLVVLDTRTPPRANGKLLWWHNGNSECVTYIPVAGEHGRMVAAMLIKDLRDGAVNLLEVHGDPSLRGRIDELIDAPILPDGWTVLQPAQ